MKKKIAFKILSVLLAVAMIVGSAPLSGLVGLKLPDLLDFSKIFQFEAEAATYSGSCGTDLKWSFDKETGKLTITGNGAMNNYSSLAPWYSYCSSIKSISLPVGLTTIGAAAFYECANLVSVTIPDSVTSIGDGAFFYCTSLTTVKIPDGVTNIGNYAFSFCKNLESVILPDGITSIGDDLFHGCESLISVIIPDSVTSIGAGAFAYCTSLTTVKIPDGVTSIGNFTFNYCENLKSVILPDSVTSTGYALFLACTSLTIVKIPDGITSIGKFTFSDCESLTSITIPDSVTSIGEYAFSGCTSITKFTIPKSVTSIGDCAFEYCESLTSIAISDKVTTIGEGTFEYCESLTDVYYMGDIKSWCGITFGDYYANPMYYAKNFYIGNKLVKEVVIHNTVTEIKNYAFYSFECVTSVTIPDSVTSINSSAFRKCTSLTNFNVNSNNKNYSSDSDGALYNKNKTVLIQYPIGNSRKTFTIPDSVISIGDYAFANCTILTTATIPDSVTSIGDYAFYCCSDLAGVYYGGTEVEWKQISIGFQNSDLINATIHYELVLRFATSSKWTGVENYTYKYSDEFFEYDSSKYHHDLAMMSLVLEASACVPNGGWKENKDGEMVESGDDYSGKKPKNAELLLKEIGFNVSEKSFYGYDKQPDYETIACTIASKNISDKNTTVIAVAVRGGGYEAEWAGNFNIGKDSVDHKGFSNGRLGVLQYIEDFVTKNKDKFEENVKFWIVGYSRGAAVANLVAAEFNKGLNERYFANTKALNVTKQNIYCYGFETPQNTTDKNANTSAYNNIFSIVNPIDPVPKVAPSSKGFNFRRYGVTYYLPATETISNYNGKNGIKSQMNSVHKDIYGEDYKEDFIFYEADLNGGIISVKQNKSIGQMTYMNNLIDIVATEGLKNRTNYYNNYQGAVQDLMAMFLGGYNTPDVDVLWKEIKKVLTDYVKNRDFISFHPIENLKMDLATVIADNTEVKYSDAMKLLRKVDDLLLAVVKHPNYLNTTISNAELLFYPHYGNVLVGWMAYLETLPEATRNKLLSTSLKYRTVKVNCPVDINVYDSESNLVASIINDEVISVDGAYLSTYIDENGQKCVVMPNNEEYRIEVTAREDCEVTCSVSETNGETLQNEKVVNYYEINVAENETITCTAENAEKVDECQYPMTDNNGEEILPDEILVDGEIESFTVIAESNIDGISVCGGGEFTKGEFAQVSAFDTENYVFTGWYIGDTLVSEDYEYRFLVTEDITLIADFIDVYEYETEILYYQSSINYKDSLWVALGDFFDIPKDLDYVVEYESFDESVVSVDDDGYITTNGTGNATVTCTVTFENGYTQIIEIDIEVTYSWWQWIIIIFLFGWIWY